MTKGHKKTCEKLLALSFKSFQKKFYINHKILVVLETLEGGIYCDVTLFNQKKMSTIVQ